MAEAKKFHVHCELPNASKLISGIEFADHPAGGVCTVEPVDSDVAEHFASIPGYKSVPAKAKAAAPPAPPAPNEPPAPPAKAKQEDLL